MEQNGAMMATVPARLFGASMELAHEALEEL